MKKRKALVTHEMYETTDGAKEAPVPSELNAPNDPQELYALPTMNLPGPSMVAQELDSVPRIK